MDCVATVRSMIWRDFRCAMTRKVKQNKCVEPVMWRSCLVAVNIYGSCLYMIHGKLENLVRITIALSHVNTT